MLLKINDQNTKKRFQNFQSFMIIDFLMLK